MEADQEYVFIVVGGYLVLAGTTLVICYLIHIVAYKQRYSLRVLFVLTAIVALLSGLAAAIVKVAR